MAANKAWKFDEAKALVAAMRSKVNQYGYEVTIGGSVLIDGKSGNDLDLFFIPRQEGVSALPVDLLMWLATKFGPGKTIIPALQVAAQAQAARQGAPYTPPAAPINGLFAFKGRFDLGGHKVDVFVVNPS